MLEFLVIIWTSEMKCYLHNSSHLISYFNTHLFLGIFVSMPLIGNLGYTMQSASLLNDYRVEINYRISHFSEGLVTDHCPLGTKRALNQKKLLLCDTQNNMHLNVVCGHQYEIREQNYG